MAVFSSEQIGTSGRYAVARIRFGVKKWFAQTADGTKVWGDPHSPSSDDTFVFDFEPNTAFLFSCCLSIADAA